jgi:hypothetical protein
MKTPITPGEILLGSATHTALKQATDQHGWTPMQDNETAQAIAAKPRQPTVSPRTS